MLADQQQRRWLSSAAGSLLLSFRVAHGRSQELQRHSPVLPSAYPPPQVKRMVIPDALKVLRLQHGHRYCQLGALASSVGWKHEAAVKELEAKRKVKVRGGSLCCKIVLFLVGLGEHSRSWRQRTVAHTTLLLCSPFCCSPSCIFPPPVQSAAYYEAKKKLRSLRAKAESQVA